MSNYCRSIIPTYRFVPGLIQKRHAGFQATKSSSNISMEMRMRLIERKKRKVEKLGKEPLELIPIVDYFVPISWRQDSRKRASKISEDIQEERILLEKAWSGHVCKKRKEMSYRTNQLIKEQQKALRELKAESQSLYEEAIKCISLSDIDILCRGPVQTMPISNYLPPLGGYKYFEPPFSADDTAVPDV